MSILLWITIEMKYKIKCLNFFLLFTNGRQKIGPQKVNKAEVRFIQLIRQGSTKQIYQGGLIASFYYTERLAKFYLTQYVTEIIQ